MRQIFHAENFVDDQGRPAGGWASAPGLTVQWQNGPLMVDGVRRDPSGAFVETVIAVARQRIAHYQAGRFACAENAKAIEHLDAALAALNARTADRTARGVEGTHEL